MRAILSYIDGLISVFTQSSVAPASPTMASVTLIPVYRGAWYYCLIILYSYLSSELHPSLLTALLYLRLIFWLRTQILGLVGPSRMQVDLLGLERLLNPLAQ